MELNMNKRNDEETTLNDQPINIVNTNTKVEEIPQQQPQKHLHQH